MVKKGVTNINKNISLKRCLDLRYLKVSKGDFGPVGALTREGICATSAVTHTWCLQYHSYS
jgi:hypothetical protein